MALRGVAVALDTREHARKRLSEGVDRGILAAKVEEIVREVVRGVRTPIREEEVRTAAVLLLLLSQKNVTRRRVPVHQHARRG